MFLYRFRIMPEENAKRKRNVFYVFFGFVLGIILIHPFSMVVFSATGHIQMPAFEAMLMSFQLQMWPMWLWYGALGGCFGWISAIFVNRIRILEGMMPICAWCGRIKDKSKHDEMVVEWKRLDQFLSEKGIEETSGICPDCFQNVISNMKK